MPGGNGAHPWKERRAKVLERYSERVPAMVTPIGYSTTAETAVEYAVPEVTQHRALVGAIRRLARIEAIRGNQEQELAPEYLLIRSAGIDAKSINDVGGEFAIAEELHPGTQDYADAYDVLAGSRRTEEFLRQEDERYWYSGYPKPIRLVANAEGKRGVVPVGRYITRQHVADGWARAKERGLPSSEAIAKMMASFDYHRMTPAERKGIPHTCLPRDDAQEREAWKAMDDLDAERTEDFTFEQDERETPGYAAGHACPNPNCLVRGDDCRVCGGTKTVPYTLGFEDAELDAIQPGSGW